MEIIMIVLLIVFVAVLGGRKMVKDKIKGTSLENDIKEESKLLKQESPVLSEDEKPPQCTKKKFNTEVEAQIVVALHENKRKRNKSTHRKEQKVYHCPLCGFWHVSSQEKTLKESEK